MLAKASTACPIPSNANARPNAMNSSSRVRRQKRRKNSPHTPKPNATAPERKSYNVMCSVILHLPNETPDHGSDRGERQGNPNKPQVDRRGEDHQVQD